jgi:hypothetical protein
MTKIIKRILYCSLLTVIFFIYSCDLIDPTEVKNPSITEENLLENANGGTASFIVGLHSQFSSALIMTIYTTEPVSDNYDNRSTFISPSLDFPRNIRPDDATLGSTSYIYFQVQNLRALAEFGLSTIIPRDPASTTNQTAEVHFYRGFALLLLAENFWAFPITDQGPAITSADAVKIAIEEFKTSFNLSSDVGIKTNSKYALARAYRLAGDKTNAEQEARDALAMSPLYLFSAEYDETNRSNYMQAFLVERLNNDLQPLPRLDFLDPKYFQYESPTPAIKAEEAHLILAEVEISNGDLTGAKTSMKNAIEIARNRNKTSQLPASDTLFIDRDPRRSRPGDPSYMVKASAAAPAIAGLIQRRNGSQVIVYPISNTSLTAADIDALTTQNEIVRALYLLRQEIFFLEGRRMSDLGIRLPVMQREIDVNKNFPAGSSGTTVQVPGYIPQSDEMDRFTTDAVNKIVTCLHDMNQKIADNYAQIKPFK